MPIRCVAVLLALPFLLLVPRAAGQVTVLENVFPDSLDVAADGKIVYTRSDGEFCVRRYQVWRFPGTSSFPPQPLIVNTDTLSNACEGFGVVDASGAYTYVGTGTGIGRAYHEGIGYSTRSYVSAPSAVNNIEERDERLWIGFGSTLREMSVYSATAGTDIPLPGPIQTRSLSAPGNGWAYCLVDGNIVRANAASTVQTIGDYIQDVACLTALSDKIYFGALNGFTLFEANIDGSSPLSLTLSQTDYDITEIIADGANIYWVEFNSTTFRSSIRRLPRAGGTPTLMTDRPGRIQFLRQNNEEAMLYWTDSGDILKMDKDASTIRPDIEFTTPKLEVIQAIQDLDNTVELVEGKPTVARCFPRSQVRSFRHVEIVLHGTDGTGATLPGSPLRSQRIFNDILPLSVTERLDWDKSVNFLLPEEWTRGRVLLRAEIDPFDRILESDESFGNNNTDVADVTFVAKQPVCFDFRRVLTEAPFYGGGDASYWRIIERAEDLMPTARIIPSLQPGALDEQASCGDFCFGDRTFEMNSDGDNILTLLWWEEAFDTEPSYCGGDGWRVGMIPPGSMWGRPGFTTNGRARYEQPMMIVRMADSGGSSTGDPSGGYTLAHEHGHCIGFQHTRCTGESNTDGSFLFGCRLSSTGSIVGRDRFRMLDSQSTAPYMSYGRPRWATPYHWTRAFDDFDTFPSDSPFAASAAPASALAPPSSHVMLVSGTYEPFGDVVKIDRTYVVDRALTDTPSIDALYEAQTVAANGPGRRLSLQVYNNSGAVIGSALSSIQAPVCAPDSEPRGFTAIVPCETNAFFVVLKDGDPSGPELASAVGVFDPPVVSQITSPPPGSAFGPGDPITVEWSGSGTAGDPLYDVHYSPNGTDWSVVAQRIEATSIDFDPTDRFPASVAPGTSRFRVIAWDGFNTHSLESPGFTVLNNPPEPIILEPAADAVFETAEQIILRGRASDPEEGEPDTGSFYWDVYSENEFFSFEGADTFIPEGLQEGAYVAQLIVVDSDGGFGITDLVPFTVGIERPAEATDRDNDGVPDVIDNCPDLANQGQTDSDQDGIGDLCDLCPDIPSVGEGDFDGDGIGDACDPCPRGDSLGIVIDGRLDAAYGPPVAVQSNATSLGDNGDPEPYFSLGSELDSLHARIDCDTLFLCLPGNLENSGPFNLHVFLDTRPGGMNTLSQALPIDEFGLLTGIIGDGNAVGLTFEPNFAADFWIGVRSIDSKGFPFTLYEWMEIGDQDVVAQWVLGLNAPGDGPMIENGQGQGPTIGGQFDHSNTIGVPSGTGSASGAFAAQGLELGIPLAEILPPGATGCEVELVAFIADEFGNITSQILPPIDGTAPAGLGPGAATDLGDTPGFQSATATRSFPPVEIPVSVPQSAGGVFSLSVASPFPEPWFAQWFKDGQPLSDDGRITGAQSTTLRIDPVSTGDNGVYSAIVQSPDCPTGPTSGFELKVAASCVADLTTTGATLPSQAGYGVADGVADLDDLGYYLNAWLLSNPAIADLTTAGAALPGQIGYGVPDGTVGLDDLGYYLNAWLAGCP